MFEVVVLFHLSGTFVLLFVEPIVGSTKGFHKFQLELVQVLSRNCPRVCYSRSLGLVVIPRLARKSRRTESRPTSDLETFGRLKGSGSNLLLLSFIKSASPFSMNLLNRSTFR